MTVRVRYAPSPTGAPHIGNIRTALFDWLYARHHNGTFILRIEDTDKEREVPGSFEAIIDSLEWLGLTPDEGPLTGGDHGPYVQSERLQIYREQIDRLLAQGDAYPCFCSGERLSAMREEQQRQKLPPGYDRTCRLLLPEKRARLLDDGVQHVIRLALPETGQTSFHDEIRGDISVENSTLDDYVLLKSDGYPTYNFAHVVDDHLMRITHVMRGVEFIPSTPKFVLLYRALGWPLPKFAHLPQILGPDKAKLSKRHGATSIAEYREQGILPDALVNFLALLGWSLDDKTEVIDRETLIDHFDLDRIGKTAAVFNIEKLFWLNGVYIRKLAVPDLASRLLPFLDAKLPPSVARPIDFAQVLTIAPLIQERLRRLDEAAELAEFFFLDRLEYDSDILVPKGLDRPQAKLALAAASSTLQTIEQFDRATIDASLRSLAVDFGVKTGQLFGAIRSAVTGRTVAPPLDGTLAALGRSRAIERVLRAVDLLSD